MSTALPRQFIAQADATRIPQKVNKFNWSDGGKVRALLCRSCNTLLGYAKDSAETLERAAEYLRRFSQKGGSQCQ